MARVGDHKIVGLQFVSLPVQSEKLLPLVRHSHTDSALQFAGVERMQRLAHFEHHEIGDIDDVVDGPQSHRVEFQLQPPGTGPDFTPEIRRAV